MLRVNCSYHCSPFSTTWTTTSDPLDIRSLVLGPQLAATNGVFSRSLNLFPASWAASPLAFTGNNSKLNSLDVSEASTIVEAAQWSLTHQMVNIANTVTPELRRVVYMKAGRLWQNQVEIDFGVSSFSNVELTFRDNLGTSGQFLNGAVGSVPVYSFGSGVTGVNILYVTILQPGTYNMVITMKLSSTWSAFEMEWVVLP